MAPNETLKGNNIDLKTNSNLYLILYRPIFKKKKKCLADAYYS